MVPLGGEADGDDLESSLWLRARRANGRQNFADNVYDLFGVPAVKGGQHVREDKLSGAVMVGGGLVEGPAGEWHGAGEGGQEIGGGGGAWRALLRGDGGEERVGGRAGHGCAVEREVAHGRERRWGA
jgi:hypothetical protein